MKRMRALVQKEIFEKSSNIPFLLKWFPMPETNHFLPWAFQKCHVVRKWFPFGNDFFGNHFHLEMIFFKWFTATKNDFWLFFAQKNDLQVRKIISFQFRNDFLHKKMISKQLKNDFLEMIFGTFSAGFEDVIYSWEKKHFLRKWAFPEMNGNHFFPENALQPPKDFLLIARLVFWKNVEMESWKTTSLKLHLTQRRWKVLREAVCFERICAIFFFIFSNNTFRY